MIGLLGSTRQHFSFIWLDTGWLREWSLNRCWSAAINMPPLGSKRNTDNLSSQHNSDTKKWNSNMKPTHDC